MSLHPDNVDGPGWHDNIIYALHLRAPDPAHGDWRSELILDIDHIVEWVCGADSHMRFLVAPATLVFHDACDLRIAIDFGRGTHRGSLNELSIAEISKRRVDEETGPPGYRWRIELNLPPGGELAFRAGGFSQTLRAKPVLLDEQRLPAGSRVALLGQDRIGWNQNDP